jgi:glutathione S-transferase
MLRARRTFNMIEVWGRRSSINVQKVLWAIGELGLEQTRHTVGGSFGGNREKAYLAMNPNGLVPVIRDGDVVMFESNAIVRYLGARYGEGGLRPSSPGTCGCRTMDGVSANDRCAAHRDHFPE